MHALQRQKTTRRTLRNCQCIDFDDYGNPTQSTDSSDPTSHFNIPKVAKPATTAAATAPAAAPAMDQPVAPAPSADGDPYDPLAGL